MNGMLPLLVRRANIEFLIAQKAFFLFLSLSFRNSLRYPQTFEVYAHQPSGYPQFKKVFSVPAIKIHTACAQRFRQKNFAGSPKPQNAVWWLLAVRAWSGTLAKSRKHAG
jgi:hypothetical protein